MTTATLLTLGHLVRRSGLARASLLHYERIGLLQPRARSPAGYRLYGPDEIDRLAAIRRYREAGLPLAAIGELMRAPAASSPAALLEARLLALNAEVQRLRSQQHALARLLAMPECRTRGALRSKDAWVALLRRAGLDEADMQRWHAGFEAADRDGHDAFLRSLGLPAAAARAIRMRSRR